jgi:anti-sigma28 factor (negative regulator of flagellin synthesis)
MVRGIDPLSHQPKVSQTKQQSVAVGPKKEGAQASDTVEISGGAQSVAELTELAESTPAQSKANLDGVREKVQSGYYNTPEALENVANAMIESDALQDAVSEIAQFQAAKDQLSEVPDVRTEEVERTKQLVGSGFYNQREALERAADGMINEIV